jgi:hypothetical protein
MAPASTDLYAYASCYHATLAAAFDVPPSVTIGRSEEVVALLKSDEKVSDLWTACEKNFVSLGSALEELECARRDLSWHVVPVLLQKSIETLVRVTLDAVENSLVITRVARQALDGRPTWEALEAARLSCAV